MMKIKRNVVFLLAIILVGNFAMGTAVAKNIEKSLEEIEYSIQEIFSESTISFKDNKAILDEIEYVDEEVNYLKINGYFENTQERFAFYYPDKNKWKGRFFQRVYPLEDENASQNQIGFAIENGAYIVKTNSGSGYNLDASAAQLSREIAALYYNYKKHIYGYIYGGSGGSFQTIGAIENTEDIWDGAVPFILGVPTSIPNNFFVRAFGRFILENKAKMIGSTMDIEGSGDPYSILSGIELEAFLEMEQLGVPKKAWADYEYMLRLDQDVAYLMGFADMVKMMDPTYVSDFWNKEGYLGTEESAMGEAFRQARINSMINISNIVFNQSENKVEFIFESLPELPDNTVFDFHLYKKDEEQVISPLNGILNENENKFVFSLDENEVDISQLKIGQRLSINNEWFLALLSYHRHQVPEDTSYYAWNGMRNDEKEAKYPQRPIIIGDLIANSISGGAQYSGRINGKVIMVSNLWDMDAYPWQGDWYKNKVVDALGENYKDKFRLWFNDNADHIEFGPRTHNLVQFDGIVERALIELSNWVEKGIEPAASTKYEQINSQIVILENANQRQGVQPVVNLTAEGGKTLIIKSGESVNFEGQIQIPQKGDIISSIEWDFKGTGEFISHDVHRNKDDVRVNEIYTYVNPGTYDVILKVTIQSKDTYKSQYGKVENLDKVRIIVE